MRTVFISDDDMCTTQKLQLARVQNWFLANDWSVSEKAEYSDMVLSMSCNGWSLLEQNSYKRIKKFQSMGIVEDKLVVFGCINDAHPAEVKKLHSGRTISNRNIDDQIESLIPDCKIKFADIPHSSTFRSKEDYRVYDLTKRFVNISAGCTFNCSFCTHKPGLGERISRTTADVVGQVEKLVREEEVRIIVLMGMETSYFGLERGETYPQMLQAVMDVSDSFEINVAQFNPVGIHKYYDELLELFKKKRITDLQIPIQSTSKRLLKMMKRPEYSEEIGKFIEEAKKENTRAIWRTDLIIGWATETQEELDHSLAFAVKHFDEIATYAIELNPDIEAWKYHDQAYSPEELAQKVQYAKEFIERHGRMAHCGQQDDSAMAKVEEMRQKMRVEHNVG